MKEIDLSYRTMFAQLAEQVMDSSFAEGFPLGGSFLRNTSRGKEYWYFQFPSGGPRKYVGPCSDEDITSRIQRFRELKADVRVRRSLVSTLKRNAFLPGPERFTGEVVEAFADAGLFRLRGVLVGTVAYQCYSGLLGVRLPNTAMQTGDADLAQFYAVSAAVEDSLPPIVQILEKLDPTFRELPHQIDGRFTTQYINDTKYKVEFLTPNRGKTEYSDKPAVMPALGGASAQALRYLDFLIRDPVRTVMLHRAGVAVTVPAPGRFAVHKLIVGPKRRDDASGRAKRHKDIMQASSLAAALAQTRSQDDLAEAWAEAWERGPKWKEGLAAGLALMQPDNRSAFMDALRAGLEGLDLDPSNYGAAPDGEPSP